MPWTAHARFAWANFRPQRTIPGSRGLHPSLQRKSFENKLCKKRLVFWGMGSTQPGVPPIAISPTSPELWLRCRVCQGSKTLCMWTHYFSVTFKRKTPIGHHCEDHCEPLRTYLERCIGTTVVMAFRGCHACVVDFLKMARSCKEVSEIIFIDMLCM